MLALVAGRGQRLPVGSVLIISKRSEVCQGLCKGGAALVQISTATTKKRVGNLVGGRFELYSLRHQPLRAWCFARCSPLASCRGATIARVIASELASRLRSVICAAATAWLRRLFKSRLRQRKKGIPPCPILRHLCRTVGVTASHIAKSVLLVFCDACHSFLLAFSATGSARKRPSRAGGNRRSVRPRQHQRKKGIPPIGGMPFFWRSRRDLNSRAGYPAYALSRGASSANLSTTP